jgi:hypothetical protein
MGSLNHSVHNYLDARPFKVTRHLEKGGAEHVYRVEVCSEPPPQLGTIVGDFFHNLRSALDAVVYALAVSTKPSLTERERRRIGFPITLSPDAFNHSKIRFVPAAAQEQIERVQPYHDPYPAEDPLWLIQSFNNIDKHREVLLVPALSMGSIRSALPKPIEDSDHALGPFEDGAELARYTFPEPKPEVDLEFTGMFDVSFGDRVLPAGIDMRLMLEHVRDSMLPNFEQFF